MSQKRKRTPSPSSAPQIFRSNPITDRTSTFKAFYSPTLAPRTLQTNPEWSSASHKILAWREPSKQKTLIPGQKTFTTHHDDDGESHGGKKVGAVLEKMGVGGACVVARWYGGVMLGPVRFQHMEDVAREAVEGYLREGREEEAKRRRMVEEEAGRKRLVGALGERDRSIAVLRGLVVEKEEAVKKGITLGVKALEGDEKRGGDDEGDVVTAKAPATPAPLPIDYAAMPLDRLKALDKARDATLAFLLKRIDKAEADLKALEKPDEPP